jgi:hypothetical protein
MDDFKDEMNDKQLYSAKLGQDPSAMKMQIKINAIFA